MNGHLMLNHIESEKIYFEMACSDLTFKRRETYQFDLVSTSGEIIRKYFCTDSKVIEKLRGMANVSKINIFGFIPDQELLMEMTMRFKNNQPHIEIR